MGSPMLTRRSLIQGSVALAGAGQAAANPPSPTVVGPFYSQFDCEQVRLLDPAAVSFLCSQGTVAGEPTWYYLSSALY